MVFSAEAKQWFTGQLSEIRESGLYKEERLIESEQAADITVGGEHVLNFCANNYLGLANNEALRAAAKDGIDNFGLGLASVRFICGTQTIHKELEQRISQFLGTDDTILYAACFDANGGLFETLLTPEDAVVSDALNHASIIDGIRLSKAKRFRYAHGDMQDLRAKLEEAKAAGAKKICIATDGVFSMDGNVAKLDQIHALAQEFGAMTMVDDCHATGFFGPGGKGTPEHFGLGGQIDIVTSTLGKALGGAVGGFTSARKEIIDLLRQRSRPYLFSNSLPPVIITSQLACLDLVEQSDTLREQLESNTNYFRSQMRESGFTVGGEIHPICPVMLGDAKLATDMADQLLKKGVYVIGFSYPVVPKGQARIRVQLSAAHTKEQLDKTIEAFREIGESLGVIQ